MWQPTPFLATWPGLSVTQTQDGRRLTLILETEAKSDCVLHWGLIQRVGGPWRCPPPECRPTSTTVVDVHAVRTPFSRTNNGRQELRLELPNPTPWHSLVAVLYSPRENRWFKNNGKDFCIELPHDSASQPSPEAALATWVKAPEAERRAFTLDSGDRIATAIRLGAGAVRVNLVTDAAAPVLLHWGLAPRFRHEWTLPPENGRPEGSTVIEQALRSPFQTQDGLQRLELEVPMPANGPGPRGLRFVMYQPDSKAWLKASGTDLFLPLCAKATDARLSSPLLRELADAIIDAEVGASSWTLMHRFHLCHDLLEKTKDDAEGLALLFAWLRYSATRHLDWQRSYNTKPRELAAAQDRLTRRLAQFWKRSRPELRMWPRLMLTTLGRGGDGQRVRDEILHIMHRNHLKEVQHTFIEEWHQKLHNNTTPDDVPICEAYLAFLHSNGDRGVFYRTLEARGVTRDRLRSFERPIRSEPDFYGDRRDALIREFGNFLNILKAVHSGTDLDTAAGAVRGRLSGEANRKLDHVFSLRHRNVGVNEMSWGILDIREELARALAGTDDDGALRDLLYLDLSLEEMFRSAIERQGLSQFDRDRLVDLVDSSLRHVAVSVHGDELRVVTRDWSAFRGRPRDGREWALHARSVSERAGRRVQGFSDAVYQNLQPRAELLGEACRVPQWVTSLFSEEVVRGGPAFSLSLLLRHLDPMLRQAAGMGGWQIISPARTTGRVCVVETLLSVQQEQYAEPTMLVTDRVTGEEEVPAGVTAVITLDAPDLVSHVAVRARNAHVLFATCFDRAVFQRLKEMQGKFLAVGATPAGEVEYREASAADSGTQNAERGTRKSQVHRSSFTVHPSAPWVVAAQEFSPELVGGKSNNLNGLRGRLPEDIRLPISLALPFGVCERVLADAANHAAQAYYRELTAKVESDPEVLPQLRDLLRNLTPPAELKQSLLSVWERSGLPATPWDQVWHSIQRVWASKWNDRAYFSRRARGTPHDDLRMAVLIQQVVPADYAFVIHTTNPLSGNANELYAEVVLGLGETLVGNYPGRALGFIYRKAEQSLEVLSYPGKSVGLYGQGMIFRSDSNGEDLEGFAGAGLYDSVLAEEPEHRTLSYTDEKLVWDQSFRDELLCRIARVGLEVEKVLASPQDIEGAVTGGQVYVVQTRPQVGLERAKHRG